MPVKYEISAVKREYTTRDGQQKTEWAKIGVVMEGAKGLFVVLDPTINLGALPQKDGRVYANLFEAKPRDAQGGSAGGYSNPAPSSDLDGDSIPFSWEGRV